MSQSTLQNGNSLKDRFLSLSVVALRRSQGWLVALDRILRGETTRPSVLRERSLQVPTVGLSVLILGLALFYGLCMGMYPGFRDDTAQLQWLRWLSCTVKIPALFLLTLAVTFPSLYVVNALVGSRLQLPAVWQLLVAALSVNLAVLASAGPIVAFFSFSTTSSPFMLLLNVVVFAVSGVMGMLFLLQTLNRLSATWPYPDHASVGSQKGAGGEGDQSAAGMGGSLAETGEKPPVASGGAGSGGGQASFFAERWPVGERGKFLSAGTRGGEEAAELPSSAGRGAEGEGPQLPSASGRGAGGEGGTRTFSTATQPAPFRAAAGGWPGEHDPSALDPLEGRVLGRHVKMVFCCWTVIFGVVGRKWPGCCAPISAIRASRSSGSARERRTSLRVYGRPSANYCNCRDLRSGI